MFIKSSDFFYYCSFNKLNTGEAPMSVNNFLGKVLVFKCPLPFSGRFTINFCLELVLNFIMKLVNEDQGSNFMGFINFSHYFCY